MLRDLCALVEGSVTPKALISWFMSDSDFGFACGKFLLCVSFPCVCLSVHGS